MFSLVVGVPFSPLDIDIGHLARGEWNTMADRFRIWYIPGEKGDSGPTCYVMVRKFDPRDGVLVCGHLVVNLGEKRAEGGCSFTVGVLCNDDVRARTMLNSLLDIPPSFHRRSEMDVIERRWRNDPKAVMRYLANVHSSLMNSAPDPVGKVRLVRFDPPPGLLGELKRGMSAWW